MKNLIARLFIFTSSIFLCLFLYNYHDTSVDVIAIESRNGFINIEFDNPDEMIIKYSYNKYFFDAEKITTSLDRYMIAYNYDSDIYIKIYKPEFDIGIHNIKTYKILNHEHNFMIDRENSIQVSCAQDGKDVFKCIDCDYTKYNTIPKLHCEYSFVSQKEPSCTEDGYSVWRCQNCGKVQKYNLGKMEHQFVFDKILLNPTCTKEGEDLYKCYSCEEEKIEKTEMINHSYYYAGEFDDGINVGITNRCNHCGKTSNKSYKKQFLGSFHGVIHIPSVGVTVPVYEGIPSQPICDATNSASMQIYSSGIKPIVADHNYQGFTNIRNAKVGSTIMYYQGQKYICTESFNGTNTGYGLVNSSGVDIMYGSSQLYLYTCNDKYGKSIRVVGWNRV